MGEDDELEIRGKGELGRSESSSMRTRTRTTETREVITRRSRKGESFSRAGSSRASARASSRGQKIQAGEEEKAKG